MNLPLVPLRISYQPRIPDTLLLTQTRETLSLQVPRLQPADTVRIEPLVIAGGGPSLDSSLDEIRKLVAAGAKLIAVNEVPQYLSDRGLPPWAAIHLGPVDLTTRCIGRPLPDTCYYIASICPRSAFDAVADTNTVMWHAATDNAEVDALLASEESPIIRGGQTAGLRAIAMGWLLGFRRFHLFGFDSSTDIELLHSYDSVSDGVEEHRIQLQCCNRMFETTPELAGQVQ